MPQNTHGSAVFLSEEVRSRPLKTREKVSRRVSQQAAMMHADSHLLDSHAHRHQAPRA